jgi:myo-inositol-1(or 4)-monophosphatase
MSLTPLEKAVLEGHRSGGALAPRTADEMADWTRFGLRALLDAAGPVRAARLQPGAAEMKTDGSPVTRLELEIEERLAESMAAFEPGATLVGEELGGELSDRGWSVAVDPVDGTWAFVSGTETFTTTLAVFRDGVPVLGMVSNPATGEIGYAPAGGATRVLQLSVFGEGDRACKLPAPRADPGPVLVNLHPGRHSAPLVAALYEAWASNHVRMVRSPGGSPAWALLEAAKGSFVYVNLWSNRPASAYDLASGCLLVQGAGGEVTDLDGRPIDLVSHAGPFVAAVDEDRRRIVAELVRAAARDSRVQIRET